MASLGQLLLELGINTGAWKSGIDKATHDAKVFASEVKNAFGGVGSSLKELAVEFGGLGGQMANSFAPVIDALEPLVGALATPAGAAVAAGVAIAASGVAAIGAAVHFSETAARLGELSETTGVAVESLSVLAGVAATRGVAMDQMARALERMQKSALAAAQAGPHASNAYKDLGVAVLDAEGKMRSSVDIFNDVSKAIANTDPSIRAAEAIKIFGRAGADLVPAMIAMAEHGKELSSTLEALGAVVSGSTAQGAIKLKENTTLIGAAFEGMENQLTAQLLPALNVVGKGIVDFFVENREAVSKFVGYLADAGKLVLAGLEIMWGGFKALVDIIGGVMRAVMEIVGPILQVVGNYFIVFYNDFVKPVIDKIVGAFNWLVDKLGVVGKYLKELLGGGEGIGAALVRAAHDIADGVSKGVGDIQGAISNVQKLYSAKPEAAPKSNEGGGVTPAAKADFSFIDKAVEALTRQANKEQELANAIGKVTTSTIEAKAAAEGRAAIEKLMDEATNKGIQNSQSFKASLDAAIVKIKEATIWTATFQAVVASQTAFDKFDESISKQLAALEGEAAAMNAAEREFAKQDAALTPLRRNLAQLQQQYENLAVTHDVNSQKMKALAADIDTQSSELQRATEQVKQYDSAWIKAQFSKELAKINQQTQSLAIENNALVTSNPFGKMDAALEAYITNNKIATAEATKLREALKAQEDEQIKLNALTAAKGSGFDPARMKELSTEIKFLNDNWQKAGLSVAQYERTVAKLTAEQADLAAKSGKFFDGITAGFADFKASTVSVGETMQKVVDAGLKGIVDNFSDMVTTGKAKWGDLINSMEQMLLKSAIQNILNSLFKSLGNALGGSDNGFLNSIGSLFGGGKAVGGDVSPGKSYLVGEKGPELFTPGAGGTITPNGSMGGQQINQQFNITTPNADSFARSQKQISSQMYRDAAYAHQRMRQ